MAHVLRNKFGIELIAHKHLRKCFLKNKLIHNTAFLGKTKSTDAANGNIPVPLKNANSTKNNETQPNEHIKLFNNMSQYHDFLKKKLTSRQYDPQASVTMLEEIAAKGLPAKVYTINLALRVAKTDPDTCLEIYYGLAPKLNVKPNTASLSAMLSSLVDPGRQDLLKKALSSFEFERPRLPEPDQARLAAVLIRGCGRLLRQQRDMSPDDVEHIIGMAQALYSSYRSADPGGKGSTSRGVLLQKQRVAADIGNAMIYTYSQANMGLKAKRVFTDMLGGTPPLVPDSFSCAGVIKALINMKQIDEALVIQREIKNRKMKTASLSKIYVRLIKAAATEGKSMNLVKNLIKEMEDQGFKVNRSLRRYLIVACGNTGNKRQALDFFNEIDKPTVKEYGSLMKLLAQYGEFHEVQRFLNQMKKQGIQPNEVVFLSLMQGSAARGNLSNAKQTLELLKKEGIPLTVPIAASYMGILVKESKEAEALEFFKKYIKSGSEKPDKGLYAIALQASSMMGNIEEMYSLWEDAKMRGIPSTVAMYNTIMAGYARAKMPVQCEEIYRRMIEHEKLKPDLQTHNIRVHAYSNSGNLDEAINVVKEATKQGFIIDEVTTRSLIKACEDSEIMVSALLHETQNVAAHTQQPNNIHQQETEPSSNEKMSPVLSPSKGQAEQNVNPTKSLDLHHMAVAEAKATVLLWLGENQEAWNNQSMKSDSSDPEDLTIITGIGKRSTTTGVSVIRDTVSNLLKEKGIPFEVQPQNPGRISVKGRGLKQHFEKAKRMSMAAKFTKFGTMRYALMPVALATLIILPKLMSYV